jgi:branched-chain amino acid transport system ATP-binding protein|tara:strand:+ start:1035 stop:1676 length:642 start_codon:yes stop_codon:yes gene_type:complete
MLTVNSVSVKIGAILALKNFTLDIKKGEMISLIGRNGAGKTTLLKSIMGVNKLANGTIKFNDLDLNNSASHERAALGIGYMPEDRGLIPELTVEENILLPSWSIKSLDSNNRLTLVYQIMPELKEMSERKALLLSGGQQKMAALGRALVSGTQLLLLDEPFEGVAPALSQRLSEVIKGLKKQNMSIILSQSEQNHTEDIFDKKFLIERGENVN